MTAVIFSGNGVIMVKACDMPDMSAPMFIVLAPTTRMAIKNISQRG